MKRIAILFSGQGSNMQHIIKKLHGRSFLPGCEKIEVAVAISNRPDAPGIQKATALHIPTVVLDHTLFPDRLSYDKKLVSILKSLEIDLVVMAGFMRLVTPYFVQSIQAINIHPSLLPRYKGAHAIEESFKGSEKKAGVTVHYVSEGLDEGEIIMQKSFDKSAFKSLESFKEKIQSIEHELYSQAIKKVLGCDSK